MSVNGITTSIASSIVSYRTENGIFDTIEELMQGSKYKIANTDGLFRMYSQVPVDQITGPVLIVSSHVDCEYHITKCFTKHVDENTLLGTFDNSITNAAIVYLMLSGNLPENLDGPPLFPGRGAALHLGVAHRHQRNPQLPPQAKGAGGAAFCIGR